MNNTLRRRMQVSREEKARRGELRIHPPTGYLHDANGKWMVELEPLETCKQERSFTVTGNNKIELTGVLVGDRAQGRLVASADQQVRVHR